MERQPVKSSEISSIGYDPKSKILEIEFRSGRIYQYLNVHESEFKGLMTASSHESYFQANIKNHYRGVKKR